MRVELPEQFDVEAFNELLLHIADSILESPEMREKVGQSNPILLVREMLAQQVASAMLDALLSTPAKRMIEMEEAHGPDRWHCSGTYRFTQPIPREHMLKALKTSGITMVRSREAE